MPASRNALPLLAAAVFLCYFNHFHNAFQFDDSHTIVNNPWIRDWHNLPRFFTDGSTFSITPQNQTWRPLVSVSLWFDGSLGGIKPFWFHVSTFIWFLVLLGLLFRLAYRVTGREATALFATAIFGLHPVAAETINYVIQRGDLYVAVGAVASLVLYIESPAWWFLLPFVAAVLCKGTALGLPLLLWAWDVCSGRPQWRRLGPTLLLTVGLAALEHAMTPASFRTGAPDSYEYWLTQPWVLLSYLGAFVWPMHLSADTDWQTFVSIRQPQATMGVAGVLALLAATAWLVRRPGWRPVGFGLLWFCLAALPTAVMPLAEVTNDHRMFLPFVGLAIAAAAALGHLAWGRLGVPLAMVWLMALGTGTVVRNAVWHTEASLWKDVTVKSPLNGRGWMNYGLTEMEAAHYDSALACFQEAQRFIPNYLQLEINLGIVTAALGRPTEAESHFRRAMRLGPNSSQPDFFWAREELSQGRIEPAIELLRHGLTLNTADMDCRHLLAKAYALQQDWSDLAPLLSDTLRLVPDDAESRTLQASVGRSPRDASADAWLDQSLQDWSHQRYQACVDAACQALATRPDDATAYNNVAAGDMGLQQWAAAAAAAQQALRLKPDFQLARNNLRMAQQHLAEKPAASGRPEAAASPSAR